MVDLYQRIIDIAYKHKFLESNKHGYLINWR